ncbi:MAG TPA: DNA polymerase III subunit beta, partial [Candidatus Caenarcaniphilales bacterium]
ACAFGHYQIQGIEAEEFPSLPELASVEPLTLTTTTLLEGLQGALFAASTDETKQALTGLHLSSQADYLEFAATDGHRLAVSIPSLVLNAQEMAVTIPAKALRELERMLSRSSTAFGDSTVALRFDPTQIVFECASAQGLERLSCRLLDGQYPNYHQLIPQQFARQITMERQLLLGALDRIAVLAAGKNNIVTLKLDNASQQLALSAEAPQFGSGKESVPAQISGENMEIAFNVRYLIDGLKAMDSSEVQLQLNSQTAPAVVSPLGGRKMTYLIMPIQIRN